MWQLAKTVLILCSVVLLLTVLTLGFLASWLNVDPNLHGMLAFLAGVLAVGIHIQAGSGLDFLSVVLLVAAVGVGMLVSGGAIDPDSHLWIAIFAVAASTFAQARNLFGDAK